MKRISTILATLILSACGGGGTSPAPSVVAPPAPPPAAVMGPIVFIGDSITDHMRAMTDANAPGSINVGVGGERSIEMLARFDRDVLARKPRLVVILAGTNDLWHNPDAPTTSLVDMVQRAQNINARVLVGTIPPSDLSASPNMIGRDSLTVIRRWNGEVRTVASSLGLTLADFYPAMLLTDGSQNGSLFAEDHLHPNGAGNDVLWGVLKPLL